MEEVRECPFCHSDQVKKVENDKYNDLYFCESCNHRFRYDEEVNQTIKAKHSDKWHRLVDHLRSAGNVSSPEAVATEQLGAESYE